MKSIYVIILILSIVSCDSIPEIKTSLSFKQLNNVKQQILEPLAKQYLQDLDLPIDLEIDKKIPLIGDIKFTASEAHLDYLTINWDNTLLYPYEQSEDTLVLQLSDLSVSLQVDLYAGVGKFKLINSPTSIIITNLDMELLIRFDPTTTAKSWGFIPVIVSSTTNIERIQFHLESSWFPDEFFDYIVELVTPLINKNADKLISKLLAPQLEKMALKDSIKFDVPLGESNYEIGVSWTHPPRVFYVNDEAYWSLALDLSFKNTDTGSVCPAFDSGNLPDKVIASQNLELTLGGNLIDQLLWLLIDSSMLDLTIDNSALENIDLPIALTTSGLKLIIPDFYNAYGADKGLYVRIYGKDPQQNIYVRGGRVLGAMSLMADFIVDKDSTNYPQDISECTECVVALSAEIELGIMATLYNVDESHIGGQVILVKVVDLIPAGGELTTVNPINVMSTINSLVGGLLPSINAELGEGIENPILNKFGISGLQIVIGYSEITVGLEISN